MIGGLNERLDTIHAAVLSVKLPYLDTWNARRREIANKYKHDLGNVGDIYFPKVLTGCVPVYHQFVVCTQQRDSLLKWLNTHKIDSIMHYPVPIHKQKAFCEEYAVVGESTLPLSHTLCDVLLSLPMCPMMSDDQVDRVVRCIKSFYSLESSASITANSTTTTTITAATDAAIATITNAVSSSSSSSSIICNGSTAVLSLPPATTITTGSSPVFVPSKIRDVTTGENVTIIDPCNLYQCTLCDNVFVGPFTEIQAYVAIGTRTRVQSHSFVCAYVTIGEDCFVGHGVMFVNDKMKGK